MCGIVGIASRNKVSSREVIEMLKRLEYRGYDSFGYANIEGTCEKFIGRIDGKKITDIGSKVSICHTRWSTHGGVTKANSHPHNDCSGNIFVIHNGIIENYLQIKEDMIKKGHRFKSQTDTEIIAHYFEEYIKSLPIEKVVETFFKEAKGEFAILLIIKDDNKIYAFKRGSPLVLGVGKGKNILASDIYAFSNITDDVIFFNEDEFAIVEDSNYTFYKIDPKLKPVKKDVVKIQWAQKEETKEEYDHYMIKEIKEQPEAVKRLLTSLQYEQKNNLDSLKKMIKTSKRVVFIAAGSSYHASLLGVSFLNKVGIETHTSIASEFKTFNLIDDNTLVIAISQSGETMDVIEALRGIKQKGVKIASLVNVPYSTIQRMSNVSINIQAGQERCVAATKTFTNQVLTLAYLAHLFGYEFNVNNIPEKIESIFDQEDHIKKLAKKLKYKKDIYIIGRGYVYPIAREIALKLKEIAYIHAEGMMGGELKHGTLALIEDGVPVISLIPKEDRSIISNTKEVEARGGYIIPITNNPEINYPDKFIVKTDYELHFCIMSSIVGQLLTYYTAKEKNLPIDMPRNLAKSVTVK
ncbi:MAG: glutamine--fructose-6-phosphate transaminase (isomerizing) [Candidatus Aenigmarchaeota archaeon]|nr:glutamine--fructose-6-phosphate transaminase (isomerizing) [Candidatus Aenigmarchaeota archaeon]